VKLNFHAKAEPGKPIILRTEKPGRTIFQGSSELFIDGPFLVVSGFKFDSISKSRRERDTRPGERAPGDRFHDP
jgi:hypothetical protein